MKVILPFVAVDLGGHLVGADVLGDAAGLARHHVGVPDRVEQLGLAVVDVTHDGDDRRPGHQVGLVALVLAEVDVERLEQLPVLFLGRDDLDVVVQLGAEQLEGLVVDRLGRGHHLAEVEQHLDQRRPGSRRSCRRSRTATRRGTAGSPGRCRAEPRRRRSTAPACCRIPDAAASSTSGPATASAGTPEGALRYRCRPRPPPGRGGPPPSPGAGSARRTRTAAAAGTRAAAGAAGRPAAATATATGPGTSPGAGTTAASAAGTAPPGTGRAPGGRACSSGSDGGRRDAGRRRTRRDAGRHRAGPAGTAPGRTRTARGRRDRPGRRPKDRDAAGLTRRAGALGPRRRRRAHAGRG